MAFVIELIGGSERCRFKDCLHRNETGCAVNEAIQEGLLDTERLNNFNKMQREAAELSLKMLRNINTVEKIKGRKYAQILQNDDRKKRNGNRRRG
jgi:ribosome biogenesis GTPase / thiamine phosphate phosphatase